MILSIELWLEAQTSREDAAGSLSRAFLRRPNAEQNLSFDAWVIATPHLPVDGQAVLLTRLEFEHCAAMLAAGRRCETFPRVLSRERFKELAPQLFEHHRKHPNIDGWKYLHAKYFTLEDWLKSRKVIYLDTNHWVNLRHIVLNDVKAQAVYKEILSLLGNLVRSAKVVCPISFPLFCEVLQQEDQKTRYATADVMQALSLGVTLSHPDKILQTECRAHLSRCLFPDDPNDYSEYYFSKSGYLMGEKLPFHRGMPKDEMVTFQKVLIDFNWEMEVSDLVEMGSKDPKLFIINHERFAWATDEDAKWYRQNKISFRETWGREAWRIIQSARPTFEPVFKGTFEKHTERCLAIMSEELKPEPDPINFPSIQVLAGVNALMIRNGKRFVRNDMLDFEHSSMGVPYCDIFCCDRPMAATLTHPLLALDKAYETEILSDPVMILDRLKTL